MAIKNVGSRSWPVEIYNFSCHIIKRAHFWKTLLHSARYNPVGCAQPSVLWIIIVWRPYGTNTPVNCKLLFVEHFFGTQKYGGLRCGTNAHIYSSFSLLIAAPMLDRFVIKMLSVLIPRKFAVFLRANFSLNTYPTQRLLIENNIVWSTILSQLDFDSVNGFPHWFSKNI